MFLFGTCLFSFKVFENIRLSRLKKTEDFLPDLSR
jgi:hypothetical protein